MKRFIKNPARAQRAVDFERINGEDPVKPGFVDGDHDIELPQTVGTALRVLRGQQSDCGRSPLLADGPDGEQDFALHPWQEQVFRTTIRVFGEIRAH